MARVKEQGWEGEEGPCHHGAGGLFAVPSALQSPAWKEAALALHPSQWMSWHLAGGGVLEKWSWI